MEVDGKTYHVIGVMEKAPGGLFGGDPVEDRQLIVPFETIKRDHPEIEDITINVKAKPDQFGRLVDEITELMRRRRGGANDKSNRFGISTPGSIFGVRARSAS